MKECFNKAADKYDSNCHLQLRTGDKLLSLIDVVDTAIDLGCGTGIISDKIKCNKLYALDVADKFLEKARQRLKDKNVTYLEQSFNSLSGLQVDLAFANMSLQWSDNLKITLDNIRGNIKPGGVLAFSIPLTGTFANIPASANEFYSFQQVIDMLKDWKIIHLEQEEIGYIFPSLIDALRSIKSVGADYCKHRSKRVISRDKSPVELVYNIGYFTVTS
jgi:malonyl-CoA O-methyltransferase